MEKAAEAQTPGAMDANLDAVIAKTAAAVAEKFDAKVKALETQVATLSERREKATNHMADAGREVVKEGDMKDAAEGTGINFVRMVKAMAIAKMTGRTVEKVLELQRYRHVSAKVKAFNEHQLAVHELAVSKGLTQGTFADGGALVPEEFSAELIPMLKNMTVVRKAGANVIEMKGGNLTINKMTGAATSAYIGEGTVIAPSKPSVGQIKLSEKKLGTLVVVSNDLLKNAGVGVEQMVLQDILQQMAIKEDSTFLFGTASAYAPGGLETLLLAANYYAATASSAKVPTLPEIKFEIGKAFKTLKTANVPMSKLAWFMSPRSEEYIATITDSNGNAQYEEAMAKGVLRGAPVFVTNQIGEAYDGTTDASRIFLVDMAQMIIGDSMSMEVTVDPNGAYEEPSGTAKSGFSRDETPIRVISKHDTALRYDACGVDIRTRMGAP